MSIRRLIVEIDTSSVNVVEFCAKHRISTYTFYKLRRRYKAEGEAGLEPRSRAPKVVANKTPVDVEDRIVELRKQLDDEGLDAGPATIRWHLTQEMAGVAPSESTIWRLLTSRGFITPDPKKRPKTAHRFEAGRANEVWQIDGTNWVLADGTWAKIIGVIDDGSRVLTSLHAAPAETINDAWKALLKGATTWGLPERVLSDNGSAFVGLKPLLAAAGIGIGHSRPYHPQTCGKIERSHQTVKKWLAKQPRANTLDELQTQLEDFTHTYNHERPHRSIGRQTPAARFAQMSKTGPASQPLQLDKQTINQRTVDTYGRIRVAGVRIALGNKYTGQTATAIITGRQAHILINGQLIRQLQIDPNKLNQPKPKTKPHASKP